MKKVVFGQVGRLKKGRIEEYEALHTNPWPHILQLIHDCNLRNYSIFRQDDLVFAYFEYVGEDYDADMAKMAADEENQRWWTIPIPALKPTVSARTASFMRI